MTDSAARESLATKTRNDETAVNAELSTTPERISRSAVSPPCAAAMA